MSENERRFLVGLEKLSRETGVVIAGCGCCDSPFLADDQSFGESAGYALVGGTVMWVAPEDGYDWENYKDLIVK